MRYLIPLILFLTACQQPGVTVPSDSGKETAVPPMPTLASDMIRLGETVYAQSCASCHGADLEGEPDWKTQNEDGSFRAPPHDASGHTWHHGDPTLLEAIRLGGARFEEVEIGGSSDMPAFAET